jgi:hypothetical protein
MKYISSIIVFIALLLVVGCGKKLDSHSKISNYDLRVSLSDQFDSLKIHAGLLISTNLNSDDTLKIFLGKDFYPCID